MSYYFVIVGSQDNPLFEYEFGTTKAGGDGLSHFREEACRLNQFIVHSSLDIAEEVQWTNGGMYHRTIDRFYNSHISLFQTGTRARFLLLQNPDPSSPALAHLFPSSQGPQNPLDLSRPSLLPAIRPGSSSAAAAPTSSSSKRSTASSVAHNPSSPQAEEAIRQFFSEVYEVWLKAIMSPFYVVDAEVKSVVFRQRVAAAARKYL